MCASSSTRRRRRRPGLSSLPRRRRGCAAALVVVLVPPKGCCRRSGARLRTQALWPPCCRFCGASRASADAGAAEVRPQSQGSKRKTSGNRTYRTATTVRPVGKDASPAEPRAMPIARATKAQVPLRAAAAGRRTEAKARPGRTRGCSAREVAMLTAAPTRASVLNASAW